MARLMSVAYTALRAIQDRHAPVETQFIDDDGAGHPTTICSGHWMPVPWPCEDRQTVDAALSAANPQEDPKVTEQPEHDINCGIDPLRLGEDIGCTCYVRFEVPDDDDGANPQDTQEEAK